MSKNGIRVEEFSIYMLGGEAVSYHLKDIHTLALQVTEGNIGILSLELEVELCYFNNGAPFIEVYLARGTKDKPETDRYAQVKTGDWFVILWDEIHIFRDKEFRSTFSFDGLSGPEAQETLEEMRKYAEKDVKDTEQAMKPHVHIPISGLAKEVLASNAEQTQVVPAVGELPENPHNTQGVDTP